jgi:glycerol transport system ATP-binding protein
MLRLANIARRVDSHNALEDISLELKRGELNILLGPTLSGKTSLMRVMAGLDRPDSGELTFDGESVVGVPVQKRDLAMVYQQFINYPSLSVYENIASPLRVAGLERHEIEARVAQAAQLLKLEPYLNRKPANLSGGQQQRVALARALVKRASLVLLDEPLANLDYKLREELRAELPVLFAELGAVLVYATTEPSEALVLGGKTACLNRGRLEQFGPTLDLYRDPDTLMAARLFSDPPLNSVALNRDDGGLRFEGAEQAFPAAVTAELVSELPATEAESTLTLAVRGHHLRLGSDISHAGESVACESLIEIRGTVDVTEITGSESFVHFTFMGQPWVALLDGIHAFPGGAAITLYARPHDCFLFYTQTGNRVRKLGGGE